jgi:hypothetical protein
MAGSSVTFTRKKLGEVLKVKAVWVSDDAAGTASGATTFPVVGYLMRMTTVPDGGGTAPTALYDITLKDEDGLDILNGLGADRSATATEHKTNIDGLLFTAATTLTLAVAAAGNSKGGTVYLYFLDLSGIPV